jgi:hypothetical protein
MKSPANFVDLVGKRFGCCLVEERVENAKAGGSRWLCLCGCGKRFITNGSDLKRGNTKSCGHMIKNPAFSRIKIIGKADYEENLSELNDFLNS